MTPGGLAAAFGDVLGVAVGALFVSVEVVGFCGGLLPLHPSKSVSNIAVVKIPTRCFITASWKNAAGNHFAPRAMFRRYEVQRTGAGQSWCFAHVGPCRLVMVHCGIAGCSIGNASALPDR